MFGWFKKRAVSSANQNEPHVRVYLNPLHAMLAAAEKKKGSHLTQEEVLHVRDVTGSIDMPLSQAEKFYASLDAKVSVYRMDPDRIWEEWQEIRSRVEV